MTEQEPTQDQPESEAPTEKLADAESGAPPARGKLTRLRSTGMLAGVASGLGRYFSLDPVIFRIAFGVSLFFGGFGALAYIALALFVPDEEGEAIVRSSKLGLATAIVLIGLFVIPAGIFWDGGGAGHWAALWLLIPVAIGVGAYAILHERGDSVSGGRVVAAVFIAAAAVVGFLCLAFVGAAITAFGYGGWVAAVVLASGVALAIGAIVGRRLHWLIVPAFALATGVGVAAAADIEIEGGIGKRSYTPVNQEAIPADGYQLGVGQLNVDLRNLEWGRNAVVPLDVDLGVGQASVAVPSDVCVVSDVHATGGDLRIAGQRQDGADVDDVQNAGSTATPRLELSGDIEFGQFRVINDDDAPVAGGHDWIDDGDAATQRAAQQEACAG